MYSEPNSELGDKWRDSSISNPQEKYYDHASCERKARITKSLSNTTEEDQNDNRKNDNEANGSNKSVKSSIDKRSSIFKRFSTIIEEDPNDYQEKTGNVMYESNKDSEEDTEEETNKYKKSEQLSQDMDTNEIISSQNDDIVNEENNSSHNSDNSNNITNTIKLLEEPYQQSDESHYSR